MIAHTQWMGVGFGKTLLGLRRQPGKYAMTAGAYSLCKVVLLYLEISKIDHTILHHGKYVFMIIFS